jgi:hypothetical protein
MGANLPIGRRDDLYARVLRQLDLSANRRDGVFTHECVEGCCPAGRIPVVWSGKPVRLPPTASAEAFAFQGALGLAA